MAGTLSKRSTSKNSVKPRNQKAAGIDFKTFTQTLSPDIYSRAEKYGEEFGFSVQDVVRQATAQFLIRTGF